MTTLPVAEARERNCYLTTTGRVTGMPHEIEIWFAADGQDGTLYLLSGGQDRADWVKNIRRHPEVRIRIGNSTYRGSGRIVQPGESEDLRTREVVVVKYQGWQPGQEFSQWARESLPVAIVLDGSVDQEAGE